MLFENSVSQWLHFLKRRCSYLKCGEIEGEGERGLSLLTHFPNACNGWGWATLKPGDRTSSGSSSGWQRYKHWGHILLLSQWWAGSWTASGAGGTWTSVYVGCWCYRGQLHTLCHNTSPSENTYSREVKKVWASPFPSCFSLPPVKLLVSIFDDHRWLIVYPYVRNHFFFNHSCIKSQTHYCDDFVEMVFWGFSFLFMNFPGGWNCGQSGRVGVPAVPAGLSVLQ